MPVKRFAAQCFGAGLAIAMVGSVPALAKQSADLAGTWELALGRTASANTSDPGSRVCRIMLRPQRSDNGDYFLGMTAACRHAMPALASAARWAMPDATHVTLDEPTGAVIVALSTAGDGFTASVADGTYTMRPIAETGRSAAETAAVDSDPASSDADLNQGAKVRRVAKHPREKAVESEKPSDLAGRYAVLRDKRDTGCMVTLDDGARVKGGDRAQLAPGCRDQGIVIFDPSAWMIVKGELVLTARAGHKTVLEKRGEGTWAKDAKDGGKALGLKKL